MKPKKTPKADLRRRRVLFFQIGFIVALAAAIFTFSIGQTERFVEKLPPIAGPVPEDMHIPPTDEKRPEIKIMSPQHFTDLIKVVPNHTVIETNIVFPEYDDIIIQIPKVEDEPLEEIPPMWDPEEKPTFQGGDLSKFRNWVFSQIEYPRVALDNGIQGKVVVKFVVEKDGTLSNIEVEMTPDRTLAEETVRVLKTSPKWEPGKQRGKPVSVYFILPVDYKIGY